MSRRVIGLEGNIRAVAAGVNRWLRPHPTEEDRVARPIAPARPWRSLSPGPSGRRPRRRGPAKPGRMVLRIILATALTLVFVLGWSVGQALTTPGGGTFSQRMAEWARNHYMGPLVTFGEWLSYTPPKRGGNPNVSFDKLGGSALVACTHGKGTRAASSPAARTSNGKPCPKQHQTIQPIIPPKLGSPAGKPLAGEGVWRVALTVHGVPALLKTYVRQGRTYSSYYVGIVSMDQRLLKFSMRPGTEDPGYGNWGAPMDIPPGHRRGLVATFNSGFRVASSMGGFFMHGHFDGNLVRGAASEVYYRDGRMSIGVWGSGPGFHLGPTVTAVRQNLKLIVIHGRVPANVNQNVLSNWGATLGGGYNVWRSGVGVTHDGRIIFVYGPALDVTTLAHLLQRAGCWNAMELDINPDWTDFMYYLPHHHPANPTPVNLLSGQLQPPYRYYSISNRDFTAVFAR